MSTTEYKMISQFFTGSWDEHDKELVALAADGWTVVRASVSRNGQWVRDVILKRDEANAPQPAPEPTDDEILEWRLIRAWALTSMPPVGKNGLWMLSLAAKYEQKLIDALPESDLAAAMEDPRGAAPADPVREALRKIDMTVISPLEAMTKLHELKRIAGKA